MKHSFEVTARLAKACPFCGGKKINTTGKDYYYSNLSRYGSAWVTCEGCGAEVWNRTFAETPYNDAIRAAIMRWNRRAA